MFPEVANDAPGQVGVTSTQLSTLMEKALSSALTERLGPASGSPLAISGGQDPNAAGMAQEPDNDVLRAIHGWTLDPRAIAPTEGQLIVMNQDRSIEVMDNSEYEHRSATMGMPALAGTVNTLDGIGGLDIPWGSVLLGALPGAMASEVIDGLMPAHNADGSINFTNLLVKGGVAWAGVQFGDKLVGRRASQFFAAGLILFVAADLLPVDQWVAKLMNVFSPSAASGMAAHEQGLAGQAQTRSPASTYNPSASDDALSALRGHRLRRVA